jgi:hypothetical protein
MLNGFKHQNSVGTTTTAPAGPEQMPPGMLDFPKTMTWPARLPDQSTRCRVLTAPHHVRTPEVYRLHAIMCS